MFLLIVVDGTLFVCFIPGENMYNRKDSLGREFLAEKQSTFYSFSDLLIIFSLTRKDITGTENFYAPEKSAVFPDFLKEKGIESENER